MNETELAAELEQRSNPTADKRAEGVPEQPDFWWKLIYLDPAILRGVIVSILGLVATFGLLVSDQTQGAILTTIGAIVALAQALWTRGSVTPNAKVVVYKPDPVDKPELVAPGAAISTDVVSVANAAADNVRETRDAQSLPFPEKVQ